MENLIEKDIKTDVITTALSGTMGGALIGSLFGVAGSIVGGIVGAIITGYSEYTTYKRQRNSIVSDGRSIQGRNTGTKRKRERVG